MPYNYSFMFPFEANFDTDLHLNFYRKYWHHSITASILYVCAIFYGQKLMQKRPEFQLRIPLILWNAALAAFSLLGTIRFAPDFVDSITNHGYMHSICVCDFQYNVTGFWASMFGLSKILELGDTAFIVLRKRPLIFLHWYHHVTVLVYTWHAIMGSTGAGRWFIMMNYSVHSVMYTYYALCACRVKFPQWLRMSITTFQLLQMFVGTAVSLSVAWRKWHGGFCDQSMSNLYLALSMYFSYFLLFFHFFYVAYFAKPKAKKAPDAVMNGAAMANGVDHDGRKKMN